MLIIKKRIQKILIIRILIFSDLIILYCKLKSDFIENNQIIEVSPFTEIFSGNLEEENKCKICKENCKEESDFLILKFEQFENSEKNLIKNNRKKYFNLLSDEICSKRNVFFRSFEKFYLGVFDYIFDFLSKKNENNKQSVFGLKDKKSSNFYFCENCKMNNESFKNYSIKTLPNVLLLGFDQEFSQSSQNILNLKLEKKLNLSYFQKINSEEQNFSDQDIEKVNKNFDNFKKEEYKDFLYNLKGFVKLQKNGNDFKYINFINLKDKWIKIEDFKETIIEIENLDTIVNYENEKIVFCIYEKQINKSEKFENIQMEIKLRNKNNSGVNLSHNIINRYLYLDQNSNFSSDFDFCKHYFLKPLYEDIYLKNNYKKKSLFQNKNLKIDFSKNKLFNKNFLNSENQSSAKLKYLSNSDTVSKPLSEFFLKNHYITNKNFNLNKMNYIEKCKNCENTIKKFIIKRIYHKALIMKLLSQETEERKYLIEKFWFKNYKQFLLADLRNDHLSKIFYDYNYVTEIINQDVEKLYKKFHKIYSCDLEIVDNEFIYVDKDVYIFLKSIFNSEKDVYLKDNGHLMIVKNNSYEFLNLSFEDNFVFEKLKKEDFEVEEFEYKDLVFLNRKMNALIDFKICSKFSIFNFDDNLEEDNQDIFRDRKLRKIEKYFGRKNMDNLEFDPCQIIFDIFNNPKRTTYKTIISEKSSNLKESKLIKNFDRENLNFIISNNQMGNINTIKNINDIKLIKKQKKISLKIKNSNSSNSNTYTASISDSNPLESENSDLFLEDFKNPIKKQKKKFLINPQDLEDYKNPEKKIDFEDSINNSLLDSVGFSEFDHGRDSERFSGLMSIDYNNNKNFSGLKLSENQFRNSSNSKFIKDGFEFSDLDSEDVASFLKGSGMKSDKFSIFSHNNDIKFSILNNNNKDDLDTSSEIENNDDIDCENIDSLSEELDGFKNSVDQFEELENEMKKFEKIYLNENEKIDNLTIKEDNNKRSHFAANISHLIEIQSDSSNNLDLKLDYKIIKKNAKYIARLNLKKLIRNSNYIIKKLTGLRTKSIFKKKKNNNNNLLIIKPKKESLKIENKNEKEESKEKQEKVILKLENENIEEKKISSSSKINKIIDLENLSNSNSLNTSEKSNSQKQESSRTKSLFVSKTLENYRDEKKNYDFKSRLSAKLNNKDILMRSTPLTIKENISPLEKKIMINMKQTLPLVIKEIKEDLNEDFETKKIEMKDNIINILNDSKNVTNRMFKDILNKNE